MKTKIKGSRNKPPSENADAFEGEWVEAEDQNTAIIEGKKVPRTLPKFQRSTESMFDFLQALNDQYEHTIKLLNSAVNIDEIESLQKLILQQMSLLLKAGEKAMMQKEVFLFQQSVLSALADADPELAQKALDNLSKRSALKMTLNV